MKYERPSILCLQHRDHGTKQYMILAAGGAVDLSHLLVRGEA